MTGLHALVLGAALLIGVGLGLTALGGFLIVPALVHLWPLPVPEAIATSLASSVPGPILMLTLFRRQGLPVTDAAVEMLVFSAIGGAIGGLAVSGLSTDSLALLLAVVVTAASVIGLFDIGAMISRHRQQAGHHRFGASARRLVAGASAALSAMTGAGGPVVSIPLMLAIGVEVRQAIIASQWMMLSGTFTATLVHLQAGRVHLTLALAISVLSMIGIAIGMQLARRLESGIYRRIVGITGLGIGVWLLARTL